MKAIFYLQAFESQGVQTLISVLKEAGHSCKVLFNPSLHNYFHFKLNFMKSMNDKIIDKQINELIKYNPDILCFSFITAQFYDTVEVFKKIKSTKLKDKIFIAGGIHASARPLEILDMGFDYVCVGDGEIALLKLVSKLQEGKMDIKINGIWYKRGNKIIKNGVGKKVLNVDDLPIPDTEELRKHGILTRDSYNYMTSRGCFYQCKYCFNSFYNKLYNYKNIVRKKSPEKVIDDLKRYAKSHKNVVFLDDILLFDKEWDKKFFKLYNKEIRKPFICSARIESIDEESCELIKPYCRFVHLGIESGSKNIREKIMGRNYDNAFIMKKIDLLKRHGIKIKTSFMFGMPGETKDDMLKSIALAKEITPCILSTYIFTPLPGSLLFKYLEKKNLLTKDSFRCSLHEYGKRFQGQMIDVSFVIANVAPLIVKIRQIEPFCNYLIDTADKKSSQKISNLLYKLYSIFFQKILAQTRSRIFMKQVLKGVKYLFTNEKRFL